MKNLIERAKEMAVKVVRSSYTNKLYAFVYVYNFEKAKVYIIDEEKQECNLKTVSLLDVPEDVREHLNTYIKSVFPD